jgi:hypothetical protein
MPSFLASQSLRMTSSGNSLRLESSHVIVPGLLERKHQSA